VSATSEIVNKPPRRDLKRKPITEEQLLIKFIGFIAEDHQKYFLIHSSDF